jgi:hypothetical protein
MRKENERPMVCQEWTYFYRLGGCSGRAMAKNLPLISASQEARIRCGSCPNPNYEAILKESDLTEEASSRQDEFKSWISESPSVVAMRDEPGSRLAGSAATHTSAGFWDIVKARRSRRTIPSPGPSRSISLVEVMHRGRTRQGHARHS